MSYIRHKSQKRDLEIGFFQMQILLFLCNRDYYGYELLEELHMSGRTQFSSGSMYPTLRGLEKKGYLKSRHEESASTPTAASTPSRTMAEAPWITFFYSS
jgi:DNA-binding PadR family transcriptional regulator